MYSEIVDDAMLLPFPPPHPKDVNCLLMSMGIRDKSYSFLPPSLPPNSLFVALALFPEDWVSTYLHGDVLGWLQRKDEALEQFKRAAQLEHAV